jgi:hypothetical protein
MLCLIVAILALRIGWLKLPVIAGDNILVQIAAWLIAAVFALRAIGDFRYIGFFKRIRDTRFARLDTLAYSPLCAVLAVLIGIAASRDATASERTHQKRTRHERQGKSRAGIDSCLRGADRGQGGSRRHDRLAGDPVGSGSLASRLRRDGAHVCRGARLRMT